jgi:Arc/MetJ family transcription regulator
MNLYRLAAEQPESDATLISTSRVVGQGAAAVFRAGLASTECRGDQQPRERVCPQNIKHPMRYVISMRTTLDIDDELLSTVKEIAHRQNKTAGDVVSDLLRESCSRSPSNRNTATAFRSSHAAPMTCA